MRPCQRCVSRGLECRKASSSEKCAECIRISQPCSLSVSAAAFDSLDADLDSLEKEIQRAREQKQEARSKLLHLKSRRQQLLERKGEMVNRELRNIEELEVDEMLAQLEPLPSLDPEPAPGVSPGPAGSFQGLSGFLGRTPLVPFGNPSGS
jgi:hypothetical protein